MITLTEYAKIIGRTNQAIRSRIDHNWKLKEQMEGHISYGAAPSGHGRVTYLDERGVDILDSWYGLSNDNKKDAVPIHTAVKTTPKKKVASYKRKFDSVQKKLVESLEVQNTLKTEIVNLQTELTNAKTEITMLRNRNLWQRIVNQ